MLALKFNSKLFAQDLAQALIRGADDIMRRFLMDAQAGLKATDSEQNDAVLSDAANFIHAECVFYAHSILESYGTGKKMDKDNEWLDEYMYNEALGWNPLREDETIVGRKKGPYINFFGEQAYSKGTMAGIPITFRGRDVSRAPNKAIQHAEQRLYADGYVQGELKKFADEFIHSMNPSKYFYNERVK